MPLGPKRAPGRWGRCRVKRHTNYGNVHIAEIFSIGTSEKTGYASISTLIGKHLEIRCRNGMISSKIGFIGHYTCSWKFLFRQTAN
jgi:hypothetical protein